VSSQEREGEEGGRGGGGRGEKKKEGVKDVVVKQGYVT
jgi:hypothetical protein